MFMPILPAGEPVCRLDAGISVSLGQTSQNETPSAKTGVCAVREICASLFQTQSGFSQGELCHVSHQPGQAIQLLAERRCGQECPRAGHDRKTHPTALVQRPDSCLAPGPVV